jgi:hypothetical protein
LISLLTILTQGASLVTVVGQLRSLTISKEPSPMELLVIVTDEGEMDDEQLAAASWRTEMTTDWPKGAGTPV